jgi:methyl-accepting chemotaxis protein
MNRILIASLIVASGLYGKDPTPAMAKGLGKELMSNLPGIFSLNRETEIPSIQNGNWVLSSEPKQLVETFTEQTGAIAALFVKSNDEFVRLMTTEENETTGSILDHTSPAYKHLLGEIRYTGTVVLSGKSYMVDYDVFRDRPGRVIGAYLVGIPLNK